MGARSSSFWTTTDASLRTESGRRVGPLQTARLLCQNYNSDKSQQQHSLTCVLGVFLGSQFFQRHILKMSETHLYLQLILPAVSPVSLSSGSRLETCAHAQGTHDQVTCVCVSSPVTRSFPSCASCWETRPRRQDVLRRKQRNAVERDFLVAACTEHLRMHIRTKERISTSTNKRSPHNKA